MMQRQKRNLGIYVHIPFCVKKCLYCDFLSYDGCDEEVYKRYITALCTEIEHYGQKWTQDSKGKVDTIFIGGGTPTILPGKYIVKIIDTIRSSFSVEKQAEISIEGNPKTLTEEKLKLYRAAGINRLSIGVQSLNDNVLKSLGRAHGSGDAKEAFRLARNCDFDNINLDLMFAVPQQNMKIWQETIRQAIQMAPEHISFYSLQLEENTEFFTMFEQGTLSMLSDEEDRQMYHYAVDKLKAAGYEHYEISNCAMAGKECKHNIKYWSLDNYLGVGLGAHSYVNGYRFSNEKDLEEYIRNIEELKNYHRESELSVEAEESPLFRVETYQHNTLEDDISDYVITAMRRMCGINFEDFEKRFGKKFFQAYPEQRLLVAEWEKQGLLAVTEEHMRFTLLGVDVSNTILAEFV